MKEIFFLTLCQFFAISTYAGSNVDLPNSQGSPGPSSPTFSTILERFPDTFTEDNLREMFSGTNKYSGDITAVRPDVSGYPVPDMCVDPARNASVHTSVPMPVPELVIVGYAAENDRSSDKERISAAMALLGKTSAGAGMCRSAGASFCDLESFGYANIKVVVTKGLGLLGQTSKNGKKITVELSDELFSMSDTQLAIVLGHELGHVEDFRTFSSLSLPVQDEKNPDPYMILSEAKAQLNNIFLSKELQEKGLETEPLTLREKFERAGMRITLAAWESKNTGKPIGALSGFQIGDAEYDRQLSNHFAYCRETAQEMPNSFETIFRIGYHIGEERALEQLHAIFPNSTPQDLDEKLGEYISNKNFEKYFASIGREIQRKDIAFIKQQYGRGGKLGQSGYDLDAEPAYIKKANVGIGLWDACRSAPKVQPQTAMQIKNFALSFDEIFISELDYSFTTGTCQKKLLNHIRLNGGFAGVTANWLNYVVSHGFTNPPPPQSPSAGTGGGGHSGGGGTPQPSTPNPQFPPGTWPTAGQKMDQLDPED